MRKRPVIAAIALCIIAAVGSGAAYYKWKYPYGWSHCCIIGMAMALQEYAEADGGRYPAGESSPEASLSLLYKSNYMDAGTLRGMTVPESTSSRILQGGGLLAPESCGWQYVEGLTEADDPRIALLYCKQALGHNGQRMNGGRQVVFAGTGDIQWISGDRWPTFLKEQKELLLARSDRARAGMPLVTGQIELPDGRRLDQVDGPWTMREESHGSNGSGSSTSSSSGGIRRSDLVWYRAPTENGSVTRTLSFSNLTSEPVTVIFTNGVPDVTNIVFRMRSAP